MNAFLTVLKKELRDGLRDRKTLGMLLVSSVALGPLMLFVMSHVFSDFESRAERREVTVHNLAAAPELENFLQRLSYTVKVAPADYENLLRTGKLEEPVMVIPADYAKKRASFDTVDIEVLYDSTKRRTLASLERATGALNGFNQEQRAVALAVRNVPFAQLAPLKVERVDLANAGKRSGQTAGMLGFFVLSALLYGALVVAMDSTAGERERGSLEPLLTNPVSPEVLTLGKWVATAVFTMGFALLASASFIPAQWLIKSEALAANFNYGWREAGLFVTLLVPLGAAVSAVLMASSIRCKTYKEAQSTNTILLIVANLMPLVGLIDPSGEKPWHYWVPVLGQNAAMNRVVNGEPLDALALGVPLVACVVITLGSLAYVSRSLRKLAALT